MKTNLLLSSAAVLLALGLPLRGANVGGGSIEAVVLAQDGRPVPGARVYFVRLGSFLSDEYGHLTPIDEAVSGVVEAGANGKFAARGLPPGTYHVCAQGTRPNQLGSCDWGRKGALVTVPETGAVSLSPVFLGQGTVIRFHVTSARDLRPIGSFSLGLMDDAGRYQRAVLDSTDGTNYEYHSTVPANARVRLFVDGKWAARDASGAPIAKGQPNSETIVLGGAAEVGVNLTVE